MPKLAQSPMAAVSETVMRNICAQGELNGAKTDMEKARRLGVSLSTFSDWKKSPDKIRLDILVRASMTFKCSLAWLVTDHRGENQ